MEVAADNSEKNSRVWKSLLGLVDVSIFFTLLRLLRMKCQAVGASTVRYGDVTQAAMNAQIRGLRGVVIQAAMDVQVRGLGMDLSCNSEGLCSIIESLPLNTLLPISSAADVWIIQNKTKIVR